MSVPKRISSPLRNPDRHDTIDTSHTSHCLETLPSTSPPAYTSRRNSEARPNQPPPYEHSVETEILQMPGKDLKARRSSVRFLDHEYLSNDRWGPELQARDSGLPSKSSRRPKRLRKLKQDSYYNSDDDYDSEDEGFNAIRKRIRSPRVRRTMLAGLVLLILFWLATKMYKWSSNKELALIEQSILDRPTADFSAHMKSDFAGLVLLKDLDSRHVPNSAKGRTKHHPGRLVFIGDVHGMRKELEKLLKKINFDQQRDHLILTGDMISKGYDSVGVIDLAMKLGASGVRGNHEDKVLLALKSAESRIDLVPKEGQQKQVQQKAGGTQASDEALSKMQSFTHRKEFESRILGMQFSQEQIAWLLACPVILRIGQIEGLGEVVAVHGGLVPGLKLQHQDPWFVMNMRSIDLGTWVPSDGRNGTAWTKLWNRYQKSLPHHLRSTVIYGHDSRLGLQKFPYSKGIDTACLKGGKLTAFIVQGGKEEVKQKFASVGCKDGREK